MKNFLSGAAFFVLMLSGPSGMAQGIDFDIHIGNGPPPPMRPVAGPPEVVLEGPPEMVYLEGPGIYVAVGVPYDIFFQGRFYFYFHNGAWYRSSYYRGPWARADRRGLPPGLRRHEIGEIREYRERAWGEYQRDREHYRGKHFRAEERHERREDQRDRHERRGRHDEER